MSEIPFSQDQRTYMVTLCLNEMHRLGQSADDTLRSMVAMLGGTDTVLFARRTEPLQVGDYPQKRMPTGRMLRGLLLLAIGFVIGWLV